MHTQSCDFWCWFGRFSNLISAFAIVSIAVAVGRYVKRSFSRPRGLITVLLRDSGKFSGLICAVSAPFPGPRAAPDKILQVVGDSTRLSDELRDGPIGTVLKAIEHHQTTLKHCWLIGSADSKPYFDALEEACAKYFPGVKLHGPIIVDEVYGAIDDAYNAVHRLFQRCESETGGVVKPKDMIVDVTGGTKIMSIALALACLDADRQIEYIDQKDRKTFYAVDITWDKIVRRPQISEG